MLLFIIVNTVYVANIYFKKGSVWVWIPNRGVPLLSSHIRLPRRLFPGSFPPCSLQLLPASTTLVQSYLYDKLLQRDTTVDPRKSKSNILQVMVKNGAKMLHPSIIRWNSLVKFCRTLCFCKNAQLCYWIPAQLNKYLNMENIHTDQKENSTFYLKLLFSPKEIETSVSVNRKHKANSSMPTSLGDSIWCGWCHVDEKTINCEKCHFSKISWLAFSRR